MRITKYWFRTRKDGKHQKTAIRLEKPQKGWTTACICDICSLNFNRTYQSKKFNFDKCDKCSMKELNNSLFTEEVRLKMSKSISKWYSYKENRQKVSELALERYKNKEYAEKHKRTCQNRSKSLSYLKRLKDSIDPITISCKIRKIDRKDFDGFLTPKNIRDRVLFKQKSKECLMKAKYTCDYCSNKGGRLNAHHLDGWNWCIEKRFDLNNLVCLCHGCHISFHKKHGKGSNTNEQYKEFKNTKVV